MSTIDQEAEKRKKYNQRQIKLIVDALARTVNRYHNIDDPVIRYTLIVDKIHILLDVCSTMVIGNIAEDGMDDKTEDNIKKLFDTLHKDIENLEDWIKMPTYSPEHPHGNKLLNDSFIEANNSLNK
jgi:hypothetical protein